MNDIGTITCSIEQLVLICAGLVREGVTFDARRDGIMGQWKIVLTGGF